MSLEASTRPPRGSNARPTSEPPETSCSGSVGRSDAQPVDAARTGERVDDVEIAAAVEGEPLRPAEAVVEHFDVAVRRDAIDAVARAERRRGDVQPAVRAEREVKRGDARRNRREHAAPTLAHAEDRCRTDRRRKACRPARTRCRRRRRDRSRRRHVAVAIDAMDAAVEPARHVQRAVGIERQRGRIGQIGHERLARPVGPDDEDRDRPLLPARPAEGDVEIAVAIERRTVHLMKAGRERGADLDVRRFARRPRRARTGVWPPSSPAGTMAVSSRGRRAREPRRESADEHAAASAGSTAKPATRRS